VAQPAPSSRIDTDRLREQNPIADVISSYGIELRRCGSTLVGRCPFHADGGRPNMTVFPRSGRFVCFRCQARGDAIAFVQQLEHLTFREATARLGPAGTSLPRCAAGVRAMPPSRRRPTKLGPDEAAVLTAAVELYANHLLGDKEALEYLERRGFGHEVLERQRIGFASGDELAPYLRWRRLPVAAAHRVGLLRPDGREALAGRIVFPEIRRSHPIWLIGRALDPAAEEKRYLGLPGPKPLLGWDQASRDRRGVCLVEGPLDLLTLQQWRVPGLALCGTGCSPAILDLLDRWERLYAVLDADAAGREATARLAQAFGTRLVQVQLPSGVKDPADLALLVEGEPLLQDAIRQAVEHHACRS
jgi:DNA primase